MSAPILRDLLAERGESPETLTERERWLVRSAYAGARAWPCSAEDWLAMICPSGRTTEHSLAADCPYPAYERGLADGKAGAAAPDLTGADALYALDYYSAGLEGRRPRWVPARVRLPSDVRADAPFLAVARAGEHECECNQWGAVSVRATDGSQLGVKPKEFVPVRWKENTRAHVAPTPGVGNG